MAFLHRTLIMVFFKLHELLANASEVSSKVNERSSRADKITFMVGLLIGNFGLYIHSKRNLQFQ